MAVRFWRRSAALPAIPEGSVVEADAAFVLDLPAPAVAAAGGPPRFRGVRTASIVLCAAAVAVGGAGVVFDRLTAAHLFPSTRVGGVLIGSRSVAEAEAILDEQLVAPLRDPIPLAVPHKTLRASAWDMGMRLDAAEAATSTLARQRQLPLPQRVWRRIFGDDRNVVARPVLDSGRLRDFVARTASHVDQDPIDARVELRGDELKIRRGRIGRELKPTAAAAAIVRAIGSGDQKVSLPVYVKPQERTVKDFERVIVVRTGSNKLSLHVKGKLKKAFPVATGTGGYPTPHGLFDVTGKTKYPSWYNPHQPWSEDMPDVIGPGPGNPLGTRAIYLSASGIRIHGTPQAWSIGTNASHGCIRMYMSDVEKLYELVDTDTEVLIVT